MKGAATSGVPPQNHTPGLSRPPPTGGYSGGTLWVCLSHIAAWPCPFAYMHPASCMFSCIFMHIYGVYTILYAFDTVFYDTILHNYSQNTAFQNTCGSGCAQILRTQCTTQQDLCGGFRCAVGCDRVGMHARERSVLSIWCLSVAHLLPVWVPSGFCTVCVIVCSVLCVPVSIRYMIYLLSCPLSSPFSSFPCLQPL